MGQKMGLITNTMLYAKHLEDICSGYEEYMMSEKNFDIPTEITDKLGFKPDKIEIEEFSRMLPEYRKLEDFNYRTAAYLTALMRSGTGKEFVLDMNQLNKYEVFLDNIGDDLAGKNLLVIGDVGNNLGLFARNCRITLDGDAQQNVGAFAKCCRIFITGSYGTISREIKFGTKVYHLQNGEYRKANR